MIRFVPLGGIGDVTKNMYLYEYYPAQGLPEILIVDCGVGFPDPYMYGIDLVIPDISYLNDKIDRIKGIVLTHGHEDHIAALPYILPKLKTSVYATKLTAALAKVRLDDRNVKADLRVCDRNSRLRLGSFDIEFVHITHSVPDSNHLIIRTPEGNFYHGSDFKFDKTPFDQDVSEIYKIERAAREGILSLATDCLGSERKGFTASEKEIEKSLEQVISGCRGKFIVTTQSSNISRIQQAVNVAIAHGRKVCLLGRSIIQNIEVTEKLGYFHMNKSFFISDKEVHKYPPQKVALIVAGSQGQVDSALSRIATLEHRTVEVKANDCVVFSADPIPGNEEAVQSLIDEFFDQGAYVFYSDIFDDLHVSGHGSQGDLLMLLNLTKPKYVIPIGGAKRHMYNYRLLAEKEGYRKDQILILENGNTVNFTDKNKAIIGKTIELENIMIDGLGVGDVGNIVLRDRKRLAEDGIVVIIIPYDNRNKNVTGNIDVISRGFVYMKESASLINKTRDAIRKIFTKKERVSSSSGSVRKLIEDRVEKFLYQNTHRRPMVIVVLIET